VYLCTYVCICTELVDPSGSRKTNYPLRLFFAIFLSTRNWVATASVDIPSNSLFVNYHAIFFFILPPPPPPVLGSSHPYSITGLIFQFLDLSQMVGRLGRVISSSQGLYVYTNTVRRGHTLNIHAQGGIRNRNHGLRAIEDCPRLRPVGFRDWHWTLCILRY
jgi:hypothetical protein